MFFRDYLLKIILGFSGLLLFATNLFADTQVVTYITDKQEERKSTRWTLTEWLRIKERMKEMDVWLAMFSDPKTDRFSPELDLQYGISKGTLNVSSDSANQSFSNFASKNARAQFWLTNLITASTHKRFLNIDFGVEGLYRQTDSLTNTSTTVGAAGNSSLTRQALCADFRIFGKNIQDSSFVLKIGNYSAANSLPGLISSYQGYDQKPGGLTGGGDIQIYIVSWLGVEGGYQKFGGQSNLSDTGDTTGSYYDMYAFIEISLFRFMFGEYNEAWTFKSGDQSKITAKDNGTIGAIKVMF